MRLTTQAAENKSPSGDACGLGCAVFLAGCALVLTQVAVAAVSGNARPTSECLALCLLAFRHCQSPTC